MQLFDQLTVCFGNASTTVAAQDASHKGGCTWKELGPIVNELLSNILLLGVFIAIVMIMYAGYILIQGQGSPDSRTRVRRIFINIVIGIILLVGSYYIVEFILNTLGVNKEVTDNAILRR
jgi:Na+-driven multidrug efflux pump